MSVVCLLEYLYPKYCRVLGEINVTGTRSNSSLYISHSHFENSKIWPFRRAQKLLEHSLNHCCRRKGISITYSECVSAALMSHQAKSTRRMIMSSVVCLPVPFFPHYPIKARFLEKSYGTKKKYLINVCWPTRTQKSNAIFHSCCSVQECWKAGGLYR